MRGQEKGGQSQAIGSYEDAKKNRFYDLCSRGDKETSHNIVTGMLNVFPIDVYSLLYPSATLSLATHLVGKKYLI